MNKKLLLFAIMLMSLVASAHDIEIPNADGVTIYYKYINDGTELEVSFRGSSYSSYSNEYTGNVVIPEEVTYLNRTLKVTSIGTDAFYYCSGLTSVTIPNSVKAIGNYVFYRCSSLSSITIPSSVTTIGSAPFGYCTELSSINVDESNTFYDSRNNCNAIIETSSNNLISGCKNTIIPTSVTSIGRAAFEGSKDLISIIIPEGVTRIDSYAFSACTFLSSVTFPNSLKYIGELAFRNTSLTSVTIPNSVTSVGNQAFCDCSGLTSMIVASGNTTYDSRDNCNAIIETASNTLIAGCQNTVIPNSVTNIGDGAFDSCSGLTSITIPNCVTRIGDYAFAGCYGLTSITIPNSVTNIGWFAFANSGLYSIIIPNSVTTIEDYTFSHCWNLHLISLPESIEYISLSAFEGCHSLSQIECDALSPPVIFNFSPHESLDDIRHITVYVNKSVVNDYRHTDGWNQMHIEPFQELDQEDYVLLKAFYNEMGAGEGWNYQWRLGDTPKDVRSVFGMRLKEGHITNFDFYNYGLKGKISDKLFKLPAINSLHFDANQLEGDLSNIFDGEIFSCDTLQHLYMSNNLLSGNVSACSKAFPNLKTLDVSYNKLSIVNPVLPTTITSLRLDHQTIDKVINLDMANISDDYIREHIPNILLYNHANQTYSTNISLLCATQDDAWSVVMQDNDGNITLNMDSEDNSYHGMSGDILDVDVLNSNGTPEGSTFRFCFSFDDGDGNFDGKVNILDLQTTLNYMFDEYSNKPFNFTASNLWNDDIINVQDAVCLVNKLLDSNAASARQLNAARRVTIQTSEKSAFVTVKNGYLIINSLVPVSAFDIMVSTSQQAEVVSALNDKGFTCTTIQTGNFLHIVGYSLSGAVIPAGETSICELNSGFVSYAMLADRDANEISVSLNGGTTTGVQSSMLNPSSREAYRIPVGAKRAIIIDSKGKKKLIKE